VHHSFWYSASLLAKAGAVNIVQSMQSRNVNAIFFIANKIIGDF
jgi:hypothetical protein